MVEWKTDNLQPFYVYVHSVQVIFAKYVNNFVEVLAGIKNEDILNTFLSN